MALWTLGVRQWHSTSYMKMHDSSIVGFVLHAEEISASRRTSASFRAAVLDLLGVDIVNYRLNCLEFFGFFVGDFDIEFFF